MRVVIQRVLNSTVHIDGQQYASIGQGMLILVGIEDADTQEDINWICGKVVNLRIFPDDDGVMNRSVIDVHGDILLVSQFTLHASVKKGNRPSYIKASKPNFAIPIYEKIVKQLEQTFGNTIQTGKFGADMKISLINDGPVTIIIDSKNKE